MVKFDTELDQNFGNMDFFVVAFPEWEEMFIILQEEAIAAKLFPSKL